MKDKAKPNGVTFYDLYWDTDFFGITCAKAILHKSLTQTEWNDLKTFFFDYQFVSIENCNSDPNNAQLIGLDTTAFIADVNIQFKKKVIQTVYEMPSTVKVYQNMKLDERIVEIADFKISKFIEDPELVRRGGTEVYRQWLINSFGRTEKYFAVSKDGSDEINGFLLHSYANGICTIELIAVLNSMTKGGIGTSLFRAVEYAAYQRGCDEIRVGTQVRNIGAINFYHKLGCKQVECHQVYHLWNL